MPRIVIVGGGISGLAAAHSLLQEGDDFDVLLVESEDRLGGTMGSETVDGLVFERGPNGFLDNVSDTIDLVHSLGIEDRLRRAAPSSAKRCIYKSGKLHPVPTGPLALVRSPLLSLRGRLRAFMEFFRPQRTDGVEESVAEFGRRRLGEEVVRTFLDPIVSGVFAGNVEHLSLRSAFPRIAELEREHGGLIRALLRRRQQKKASSGDPARSGAATRTRGGPSGPGGTLCSFPRGMEELVEALGQEIGDRARLQWTAVVVRKENDRYAIEGPDGTIEAADGVILAMPSYRAASLLTASEPETARALESIPYAPIAVVCFGFPREAVSHPLNGFGFLVPRDQGVRLLGVIWVSTLFPAHAPEGMVSLRCMIGGARDPDALDTTRQHLQELLLDELRPVLGIEGSPVVQRIYRYARGIPQYNLGHAARIERIDRTLWNLPGLFITGNAYHGVGVNDCVREGQKKARAVKEFFRDGGPTTAR